MDYSRRLLLSMAIPTAMVAGAGSSVVAGAIWLAGRLDHASPAQLHEYLALAQVGIGGLTAACVACCIAFTVWILRSARRELGGEPALARAALAAVADGQLAIELPPAPDGSLMHSVARLSQALDATVRHIQQAAVEVRNAAGEIAQGNSDLSIRTERTSANLDQTAGAMTQLLQTATGTAEAAGSVSSLAQSAAQAARRGGAVVGDAVTSMDGIRSASQRITEIIGTIDGIAFQTNILALNAAVEAARAGEQGRGFAVVAGEVRTLAQRSAAAAREIKSLIGDAVEQVETGTRHVREAGSAMADIVDGIQRVSDTMDGIARAVVGQGDGLGSVHTAVGELSTLTQRNAALVEQSAAAAAMLHAQSARLSEAVARFQLAPSAS